jgi:beta-fructofuranosidase
MTTTDLTHLDRDPTTPDTGDAGPAVDLVATAEADPHRPRFHFLAPAGWLNDPNGLTQWAGQYHLFYQYNPHGPVHERIHWGHATSRDLVTWTDAPVALVPDETGPDREGCWSGVLVDDDGTPTIIYSGRHDGRELPCVATGSGDLSTWTREVDNPVIPQTPPGLDVTGFRDHCVWREGRTWRHLIGSGITGQGGAALLYESDDLREWRYVGPLVVGDSSAGTEGDPDWTGTLWECVDLFRPPMHPADPAADDDPASTASHVLVFSAWHKGVTHHPLYLTGTYAGDAFTPQALHQLDLGGRYFYAPQSFSDDRGRRIVFGWLQEGRPDADAVAAGWSGVMSLPRQAVLGADGELELAPVEEVASLRGEQQDATSGDLTVGEHVELGHGDQLDVEVTLALAPDAMATLTVRATDDGDEVTELQIARGPMGSASATVRLDRSRSSLDSRVDATERAGTVPIRADGLVHVRVLVDHSALEVFVNGRALTARVYPTRPDAVGSSITTLDGAATLVRASSWQMRDIWDEPRSLWPRP